MGVDGDKGQSDDGRVVGAMQLGNETYWLEEQVKVYWAWFEKRKLLPRGAPLWFLVFAQYILDEVKKNLFVGFNQ